MLDPLRPRAKTTIAVNARLLEQAPSQSRRGAEPPRRRSLLEPLSGLPGGVAGGLEEHLKRHAPPAANDADRTAKRLTKAHPKGVGYVGDAMELASAEDKGRAVAGIVGGRVGGLIGASIPPQLLTVPIGSVVGSWAGQQAYDRRGPLVNAAKAELATLRDQLGRELKRYAPYDLQDRIARR